jgi:poly(3-hydroxybutyrate) depolymerase
MSVRVASLTVALLLGLMLPTGDAHASDGELRLAPSERGDVGVLMLQGPYPLASAPPVPLPQGAWIAAMNRMGVVDVGRGRASKDAVTFARLVVDVAAEGDFVAMLGADDGLALLVDGERVFERDVTRPLREDDDMVPMHLGAGRHELVLRLHRRALTTSAWTVKVRLTGSDLRATGSLAVVLPRASVTDNELLALTSVQFHRGLGPSGLSPRLVVQFPAGFPRELTLPVRATITHGAQTIFSSPCGDVHIGSGLARDYEIALPTLDASDLFGGARLTLTVGSRTLNLPLAMPESVMRAVARASETLSTFAGEDTQELRPTLRLLAQRLERFVDDGDTDLPALETEATELQRILDALEKKVDPFFERTGAARRAYLSLSDGTPQEVAVYVPPGYDPKKKYPLVVALHGLDGYPMAMLRWFFGKDETGKDQAWEERHPTPLPPFGGLVIAPFGHGNTMYREQGADDVMAAIRWAKRHYSVDDAAISITGPSMGGMGAAAIPFRHPDIFAAAAPLCGYHSYFLRRDIGPVSRKPWEQFVAEERSNVLWADNGRYLPLYVVHGQRDLPVENSQVLIDRYEALHYPIVHEHPDLGHNVWQSTYEELKLGKWLLGKRRHFADDHVVMKTTTSREGDVGFVHVDALASYGSWATVDARRARGDMKVKTTNVGALHLDRVANAGAESPEVRVSIDGEALTFAADEVVVLHRQGTIWKKGPLEPGLTKRGSVTGPLRDIFREPVLFVYGASDPHGAAANETVARFYANGRNYVAVHYPVMSDREFQERGLRLDAERPLFLVGNAKENALVRELEPDLPIKVTGDAVMVGARAFRSPEVGTAFIRPNPRNPKAYVVILAAPTPIGTMRAMSLPDILPDYVVYDRAVAPSRGQLILGAGTLVTGGTFGSDWSLP